MSYEQKPNTGSLFKNDKQGNEKRPDYTGSVNIDGRSYWLDAWLKDGTKGKWMSLALKPKEARRAAPPKAVESFDDDSVPF